MNAGRIQLSRSQPRLEKLARLSQTVVVKVNQFHDNDKKNYFDPRSGGISNLYLRARWVVEGMMSGVHGAVPRVLVSIEEHGNIRGRRNPAHRLKALGNSTAIYQRIRR